MEGRSVTIECVWKKNAILDIPISDFPADLFLFLHGVRTIWDILKFFSRWNCSPHFRSVPLKGDWVRHFSLSCLCFHNAHFTLQILIALSPSETNSVVNFRTQNAKKLQDALDLQIRSFKWKPTCYASSGKKNRLALSPGPNAIPDKLFQYFNVVNFSNSLFYSSMYLLVFLFIIAPISK